MQLKRFRPTKVSRYLPAIAILMLALGAFWSPTLDGQSYFYAYRIARERTALPPTCVQGDVRLLTTGQRGFYRCISGQWTKDVQVNVKDFGAVGDGVTDDRLAIQAAINAAGPYGVVYFPTTPGIFYQISGPLTVSNIFTTIKGESRAVIIRNIGAAQAFHVTANYAVFESIRIQGNGGAFGAGASGTYGIEFDGADHWQLRQVDLSYHGNHAVYAHGGTWVNQISDSSMVNNGGDGINSVSPSSAEQNGNNTSIVGTGCYNNAGDGLDWFAAALHVSGCVFETNQGAGIRLDASISTDAFSVGGVNISGCYLEHNTLGQIYLGSALAPARLVHGVEIIGNYFNSTVAGGATALIVGVGPALSMQFIGIRGNSYNIGGGVTHFVDLGSAPKQYNNIETMGTYVNMINLGATAFFPPIVPFAGLTANVNGAMYYCSDCTIASPCAGAGTGAIAKRLNGVWVCN